ncbi:hypothetical protein [Actinotalea fermentans]|uniref:Sugar transporter SemiSWEET n=1 Tax=Actinotalea fermentans TaxID=43671 RepID=A0A511Z0L3_9CELL|nr:hypothetical protein [Actinotalea fermentans]KGM15009.1 hypothetical protein N867_12955 [Actinotalea fermentans ATCC 43279 = JCM 9966 = DSM 3133]GEN80994.1 hypothetical protein AFE02nite_27280 [Actinotalea fermentans]
MDAATEVVGMLASLSSFVIWVPQGRRVWQARHEPAQLTGIAVSTQAISLVGNVLWSLYAIGIGSFWLGAPGIVNIPILTMTVVVLRRHARERALGTTATSPAGDVPDGAPAAPEVVLAA